MAQRAPPRGTKAVRPSSAPVLKVCSDGGGNIIPDVDDALAFLLMLRRKRLMWHKEFLERNQVTCRKRKPSNIRKTKKLPDHKPPLVESAGQQVCHPSASLPMLHTRQRPKSAESLLYLERTKAARSGRALENMKNRKDYKNRHPLSSCKLAHQGKHGIALTLSFGGKLDPRSCKANHLKEYLIHETPQPLDPSGQHTPACLSELPLNHTTPTLPKARPLSSLTPLDVGYLLFNVELGSYVPGFFAMNVNGMDLLTSDDDDLAQCGIQFRPHRLRLLEHIKRLAGEGVAPELLLPGKAYGDSGGAAPPPAPQAFYHVTSPSINPESTRTYKKYAAAKDQSIHKNSYADDFEDESYGPDYEQEEEKEEEKKSSLLKTHAESTDSSDSSTTSGKNVGLHENDSQGQVFRTCGENAGISSRNNSSSSSSSLGTHKDDRQAQAAVVISSTWRGSRARKRVQEIREKRNREAIKAGGAVVTIQKTFRGMEGRKKALLLRVDIQKKALEEEAKERTAKQLILRGVKGKKKAKDQKEAQQQQERKRREGAAVKIQKKVRGMEARQRAQSLMDSKQRDLAVVQVQKLVRGMQGRKKAKILKVEQDYVSKTQRAAIHIQRGFRGHGARKKAKQKKKDQQDDAAALRGPTAKNNVGEKKLTKPIEEAAVAIQRVWRGAYSREHVNILKKNKKPSQTSLLPPTTGETYAEVENRVVVVKEEEPSGEQVFALSDDIPWDFVKDIGLGWSQCIDPISGMCCFYHKESKALTWEWPLDTMEAELQECDPSSSIEEILDPEPFIIEEEKNKIEPLTTMSKGVPIKNLEQKLPEVWDKYYDKTYKAYYEVSRATGESRWLPKETAISQEKVLGRERDSSSARATSPVHAQSPIAVINQNMGNAFYDSLSLDLSDEEDDQ